LKNKINALSWAEHGLRIENIPQGQSQILLQRVQKLQPEYDQKGFDK